jgi:Zn-dependent M16 (insulinase) family peptidase
MDKLTPDITPADAPYGYCPTCGIMGVLRERRPNGDDRCAAGHSYPSAKALPAKPMDKNVTPITTAQARELADDIADPDMDNEIADGLRSLADQLDAALEQAAATAISRNCANEALVKATAERDAAARCETLERERDQWKANHDNQVAIKAAVLDRPDLGDRARSVLELRERLAASDAEWGAVHKAIGEPSIAPGESLAQKAHAVYQRCLLAETGWTQAREMGDAIGASLAASEGAGWVKCSERMPEFCHHVLIYSPHAGRVCDSYRIRPQREGHDARWWTHVGDFSMEYASHWRPLPPAPIEPGAM